MRRYYYDRTTSAEKNPLALFIYSSKYFLPQSIDDEDTDDIKRNKKTGNVALFVFYFLLIDAVIYGVLVQTRI